MNEVRYLLDTNIVSDLLRHPRGSVAQRLLRKAVGSVALSIVVAAELRFGAAKSPHPQLGERLELIFERLAVLPLETPVEHHYAEIRSALERAGTPIGPNDLFIAAHARALGAIVVTDNVREFSRVPGLIVENWLRA